MQILESFCKIYRSDIKKYLIKNEVCIKDTSESKPQLYAREYRYICFGKVEIHDRKLPLELHITQYGKKKLVELKQI